MWHYIKFLLNQLAFMKFKNATTDHACFSYYVLKNAFSVQLVLFWDALNISRCLFIFWHKNPAIFQDAFWSLFINIWVISFSFLSQLVYAYMPGITIIKLIIIVKFQNYLSFCCNSLRLF